MEQIKHVNLLRSLVWRFCRTTRIEFKDLFSEACLAYWEALRSYNPDKSAETTWIYHCVKGALVTFCQKERQRKYLEGIDWYINVSQPQDLELVEVKLKVSPDTKDILEMVASNPRRYQCAPKIAIGYIRQDLRGLYRISKRRQWTWPEIEEAMRNLRAEVVL